MKWTREAEGYRSECGQIDYEVQKHSYTHNPTGWYWYPFAPTYQCEGPFKTLREAKKHAEEWGKK